MFRVRWRTTVFQCVNRDLEWKLDVCRFGMVEIIRRFRTTLENCIHQVIQKWDKETKTKESRETKDEIEDEDEQKRLNREKGLIDHRINQGCSNVVQKRPIISIMSIVHCQASNLFLWNMENFHQQFEPDCSRRELTSLTFPPMIWTKSYAEIWYHPSNLQPSLGTEHLIPYKSTIRYEVNFDSSNDSCEGSGWNTS